MRFAHIVQEEIPFSIRHISLSPLREWGFRWFSASTTKSPAFTSKLYFFRHLMHSQTKLPLPSVNPEFKRYVCILEDSGIHTTSEMTTAYLSCKLGTVRGLGKKFFGLIKDFLYNQKKYKAIYKETQKGGNDLEP